MPGSSSESLSLTDNLSPIPETLPVSDSLKLKPFDARRNGENIGFLIAANQPKHDQKRKLTPCYTPRVKLGVQRSRRLGKIENTFLSGMTIGEHDDNAFNNVDEDTPPLVTPPTLPEEVTSALEGVQSTIDQTHMIPRSNLLPTDKETASTDMASGLTTLSTIRRPTLPDFHLREQPTLYFDSSLLKKHTMVRQDGVGSNKCQNKHSREEVQNESLPSKGEKLKGHNSAMPQDDIPRADTFKLKKTMSLDITQLTNNNSGDEDILLRKTKSLKSPKHQDGKSPLFFVPPSPEKTRRDSVVAMASHSPVHETPAKQRKVSSAPNPVIPKRRMSIKDQLTNSTSPESLAKQYLCNSIKDLLQQEGLTEHHVTESIATVEVPIYTIDNGERSVCVTDLVSLETAVHTTNPSIIIFKSSQMSTTFEHRQGTGSLKKMATGNSDDVLKILINDEWEETSAGLPPIETCIQEMVKHSTDYQSQLDGCKMIGRYADIETLQVLFSRQLAIKCIFDAMKNFPDEMDLQIVACNSLLQMSSASEANCEMVCKNDGIGMLLNTFRYYSENVQLLTTILTIWGYLSASGELRHDMVQNSVHSEVLGTMSRRSADAGVVRQCCIIVGNLVTTDETAKQIMLVGGVHTVISVMQKYPGNPSILENGCRALGSFAAFDDTCLDVAEADGTKTVIAALSEIMDELTVQECGLWALACLTVMGDTCEEVIRLQGLDVVLNSIDKYPEEKTIQEYGVRILSNLASLDTTSPHVSNKRVLDVLLRQLVKFPDNITVLVHTLSTIGLTVHTVESQRVFLQDGGVRSVVEAMKNFPEHPAIQQRGCTIIGNTAVCESLRKLTESCGASKVVIEAMLTIELSSDIQEYGCMALMNLMADVQINKLNVMQNGGILAVLTSLRNFEDNTNVVLAALKALGNIVSLEMACDEFLEENGLRTIINTCVMHKTHPEISIYSAMVLCGLSAVSDLSFDVTESIDNTLQSISQYHKNNTDICLHVCQAMENMLSTESGKRIFINDDRLSVALNLMSQYPHNVDIQKSCCKIIAILAMERVTIATECVERILGVMENFTDYTEMQIICCGTLSCILENHGDIGITILQGGGITYIATALEQHPSEHRLHVLSLMVLGRLAPSVKGEMVGEVQRLVLMAMGRFTEKHEIQIYACDAIRLLNFREEKVQIDLVLTSVRDALRRHSNKDEVLKSAGSLLRRFSEVGYGQQVENMLGSTLPQLPAIFWETVQVDKAPSD